MEVKGRINKIIGERSGVSQNGKNWKTLEVIVEYFETAGQRWSDKVMLEVFGEEEINRLSLSEGDEVIVGFGHSVREYNGRYFNTLRAYRFDKISLPQDAAPAAEAAATVAPEAPKQGSPLPPITKEQDPTAQLPGEGSSDDLPF